MGPGATINATFFIGDVNGPTTVLQPGDLAILGVNANNFACTGQSGEDEVSFVCFQDITPNTQLFITDNGYERVNAGQWGNTEGTVRITRTGLTIPAGTVITLRFRNTSGAGNVVGVAPDAAWTCASVNGATTVNLNSGGDQVFLMQGGNWITGTAGLHNATYTGTVLYGFSTNGLWLPFFNTSQQSGLPPTMECFSMAPGAATDYTKYTGPLTATTQRGWLIRIDDALLWTDNVNCTGYASAIPDWLTAPVLPITVTGFTPGLWTGAKTTDWFDCRNWDDARVPIATTDVEINQTAVRNCVVGGGGAAVCNDLTLQSSGTNRTLTVSTASSLTAGGDVTCERLGATGLVGIIVGGASTFQGASLRLASVNGGNLEGTFRCYDPTSTNQITGDVTLEPGGYLDLGGAGGELRIGGDYTNTAGDLHFNDATATLTFNGTVDQHVDHSGQEPVGRLRVNKPAGDLYLDAPVSDLVVRNNLDLLQGRVFPVSGFMLRLLDNATATNASDASFVHGGLVKEGNDNFLFPVGWNTVHRPIGIGNVAAGTTDALAAAYQPLAFPLPHVLGPGLDHISSCEYWQLGPLDGLTTVTADVTLTWRDPYSCGVTNLPDLRVANAVDLGTWTWLDRGNDATTGNLLAGTITANSQTLTLSPPGNPFWTLASVNGQNPLPIELLAFSGRREGAIVRLEWVTASEQDNDYFTLERSADGVDFAPITMVDGAGTSFETLYYTEPDREPLAGWNYYRLRQTDFDGTTTVSPVVAVWMPTGSATPLTLQWDAELLVALHGLVPGGHWTLLDATGRILREGVLQQEHRLELGIGGLPKGTYVLRLSDGQTAESARFVR